MKVVINSDILHSESLRFNELQLRLADFCRHCASVGARIVIPRTALLEDQRHQRSLASKTVAELRSAAALLKRHRQQVSDFDAEAVVITTPLEELIKRTGAAIVVEDPLISDYRDAEKRAALRLPPAPPDAKSDEMRDLVIWACAVRLARTDGPVLLVSQDKVHSGDLGRDEADSVGLMRAKNLDEAAEALGNETEAGKLAKSVITPVWEAVRKSGLPLSPDVSISRLTHFSFSADENGRASGSIAFESPSSEGPLSGLWEIMGSDRGMISVTLRDLKLNRKPLHDGARSLVVPGELPVIMEPASSRLDALRLAIAEGE